MSPKEKKDLEKLLVEEEAEENRALDEINATNERIRKNAFRISKLGAIIKSVNMSDITEYEKQHSEIYDKAYVGYNISRLSNNLSTTKVLRTYIDPKKHKRIFKEIVHGRRTHRGMRHEHVEFVRDYLDLRPKHREYLYEVSQQTSMPGRINEYKALKILFNNAVIKKQIRENEGLPKSYPGLIGLTISSEKILSPELRDDILDMYRQLRGEPTQRFTWPDKGELKSLLHTKEYINFQKLLEMSALNKKKSFEEVVDVYFSELRRTKWVNNQSTGLLMELLDYVDKKRSTLSRKLKLKGNSISRDKSEAYNTLFHRYTGILFDLTSGKDRGLEFGYNRYFLDDLFDISGSCLGVYGNQRTASLCYLLDKSMHITHINMSSRQSRGIGFTSIMKNILFQGKTEKGSRVMVLDGSILSEELSEKKQEFFRLNYEGILTLTQRQGIRRLLINTSHSRAQQSTHEFVRYIAESCGMRLNTDYTYPKVENIREFQLNLANHSSEKDFRFTHYVEKPTINKNITTRISNGNYHGEQFLDSFWAWEKYSNPSNPEPQWNMGKGYITAIEIDVEKELKRMETK